MILPLDSYTGPAFPRSNYSRTRRGDGQVRAIVIHHGGLDIDHCQRSLENRGVSSHFGIGLGEDGQAVVHQWLPVECRAWHAGTPANDWSVGIDICQSPRAKYLDATLERGHEVEITDNPTDRGPSEIVSLDPRIAEAVREFVPRLALALGIPLRVPRDQKGNVCHGVLEDVAGWLEAGGGVLGHHHLRASKWDIAPWWDAVFGGTGLG